MNSTPDPALLAAHDLALAALHEITPVATVGSAAGYTVEADGVVSLRFETTLRGYPGWFWTVSVARVGEQTGCAQKLLNRTPSRASSSSAVVFGGFSPRP